MKVLFFLSGSFFSFSFGEDATPKSAMIRPLITLLLLLVLNSPSCAMATELLKVVVGDKMAETRTVIHWEIPNHWLQAVFLNHSLHLTKRMFHADCIVLVILI